MYYPQTNGKSHTNGHYQVEDEEYAGLGRLCSACKTPTLRHKVSEGTLVCTECSLVEETSVIDMSKEYRSFGNESGAINMDRTGEKLRGVD